MDTAVIYCWISKDQHDDHLGVDRQQKQCRELADEEGLEVVSVLVDNDISASKGRRRPAFEELVEILSPGRPGPSSPTTLTVCTAVQPTSNGWWNWWRRPGRRSAPSPPAISTSPPPQAGWWPACWALSRSTRWNDSGNG